MTMRFCNVCQNMLYLSVVQDGSQLTYVCKNCNTTQPASADGASICVSETHFGEKREAAGRAAADPAIKHDPTLPRVSNISCPFADDCPGRGKEQQVIYIKRSATALRYDYLCCHCDRFWRT